MIFELVVSATVVFAVDQCIKRAVAVRLSEGQFRRVRGFTIHHRRRRPGLQKLGPVALIALWIGLLSGALLLSRAGYFFQNTGARISLGAAVGGAGSNLYDRLRLGAVLDFLDVGWWPVFNLADVAITAGGALALWFG